MNLMNRPPMGQKAEKVSARPDYLAAVRGLRCVICDGFGFEQNSPTAAHHVICGRYGNQKTPDLLAVPLCEGHHQGDFDTSKVAIHRDRDLWVDWYGPDTDYIAPTQDRLAHLL